MSVPIGFVGNTVLFAGTAVLALGALGAVFLSGCRERGPVQHAGADAAAGDASNTPVGSSRRDPIHRTRERLAERERMVSRDIEGGGVRDEKVLDALRRTPRHWFVPKDQQPYAYENRPLAIGHGQTISQPYIVALMTELLALEPGDKVLEIGTGSGYQAAVLSELTDQVYSIEIVEPLGRRAQETFDRHGYGSIRTRIGDGYRGWPEHAPFDAVIVTCAPDDVPGPLIEQLAAGGRMCIPVGDELEVQRLVLIRKRADGSLERRTVAPVTFVPMTGEAQQDDP